METKYKEVITKFNDSLQEGLKALYEVYGKHLYQFSLRNWGLNEDEGYDILYKTLETVGKVIARYEFSSEKHFTNWLFKIQKNNILMFVRAKAAREEIVFSSDEWEKEAVETELELEHPDFAEHVITSLPANQLYEENTTTSPLFSAMEKALQLISETDRDILLLRMNNYTYDEIASMLGIDNKQLKVKFLRAKAKVQKITMDILKKISNESE